MSHVAQPSITEVVGSACNLEQRPPEEVFEDHLTRATVVDMEVDIETNYAGDVVLLTGIGLLHGRDGVRESRAVLAEDLPGGDFEYLTRLTNGDYAFLE